jgi:hypothetical protein
MRLLCDARAFVIPGKIKTKTRNPETRRKRRKKPRIKSEEIRGCEAGLTVPQSLQVHGMANRASQPHDFLRFYPRFFPSFPPCFRISGFDFARDDTPSVSKV